MNKTLRIGDTAPDFNLTNQQGENVCLSQLLAQGPVVVFFYPKDGTPGCTQQMCEFGLQYSQFKALGASVIGISGDSEQRHAKAHQQHQLPFSLLSDTGNRVREQWGVPKLLGLFPHRVTYTLNSSGVIVQRTVDLTNIGRHLKESHQALATLSPS